MFFWLIKLGVWKMFKNGRMLSSILIIWVWSKEIVINFLWLIIDGVVDDKKVNNNCVNIDEFKKKYCGEMGEMKEIEGGVSVV